MKFINNFKSILFFVLFSIFLFTGCSSKSSNYDYSSFYKDTHNANINNSLAMHRATMRPYTVFGIKYYPEIAKVGERFNGIASWYGPDFHAKKTSNGEIYNMYDMTAAHKTLPMNTVVKVDNLENGKSIIVRINDRGPFVRGRIIDLSNKAAHQIDMVRKGTADVKITVLGYNGEIENKDAPYSEVDKVSVPTEDIDALEPLDIKEDKIVASKINPSSKTSAIKVTPVSKVTPSSNTKNNIIPSSTGQYSIQIGAFSKVEGAIKIVNDYQKKFKMNKVNYEKVSSLYKVFVKGFHSYEEAQKFKNMNNLENALIVK